jgi:hypothetical protein
MIDVLWQQTTPDDIDMSQVHDLALPDPVSYVPQTAGWYLAGVALAILAVWLVARLRARSRANRYRRLALEELSALEAAMGQPEERSRALSEIPVLVKRVGLVTFSRDDAASLSGDAWLARLDRSLGSDAFTHGPGRLLPLLAYGSPHLRENVSEERARALIDLIRQWIRTHDARI